MKIGFIGLGNMGHGMAANLLKAGHTLTVSDARREAAKTLLEDGATWADTPKAVAEASELAFTSLPGPPEVQEVVLGKNGILEGFKSGGIYIDLTTSSPVLARHIYHTLKEKGIHMMDAPVSGGPVAANTGKLTLMIGGDEEVFQQCKPLFDVLGDSVNYTGSIGSGTICKLMHNCVLYGLQTILAECLTLGVKAGAEPKALWQTIRDGVVGRGILLKRALPSTYLKGKFEPPSFALRLAFKDLTLATSLGREFDTPMAMAGITVNELMAAMNRGWGDKDSRVAMLLQEERCGGIEVRIPDAISE
ncbi:NAD(P)-dependent oxidoreductase [Chloroflexota bacterium]